MIFFIFSILIILKSSFSLEYGSFIIHPHPLVDVNLKETTQSTSLRFCVSQNETTVFVASGSKGIQVIDLSDIRSPSIKSSIQTKQAQHCQFKNDILFIADMLEGLIIVNVSNIDNPIRLATSSIKIGTIQSYQYILVSQDMQFAFIISNGNLITYFLNDLSNPKYVSTSQGSTQFSPYSYIMRFDPTFQYIVLSSYHQGLSIFDIRNIISQQLRVITNPDQTIVDCIFTQESQGIYALDTNSGLYYADITQLKSVDQNQSMQVNLSFSQVNIQKQTQYLTISLINDGNYLLLGLRSVGLQLYKINQKDYIKLIYIQTVQSAKYLITTIIVSSKSSQYIYLVNGISFLIFQTDHPNLNKDFPNFFNQFQSSLLPSQEQNIVGVSCLSDNLLVSYPKSSVIIYDISNDAYFPSIIKQIQKIQNPKDPSDLNTNFDDLNYVEVSSDGNTLYLSSSKSGLITFDIKDKQNPILKNKYLYSQKNDQGQNIPLTQFKATKLSSQKDKIVVSNSIYGAVIFDISSTNPTNLQYYKVFQNNYGCVVQPCDFTSDGLNLACPCREEGTFLFDLTESSQIIKPKFIIQQIGAEQAKISSDDKLLFIANGFQGLLIFDVSNFFSPIQLSQIILEGWTFTIYPIMDDQYIIITQIDGGQITLINIKDPKNPYTQQKINFPGETSTNVCINPKNPTIMFFVGNMGLRYFPIQNDLAIHSQFQVAYTTGINQLYKTLKAEERLFVGQQIKLTFQQLYSQSNIKIQQVQYLNNNQKQALPSWISYAPKSHQIIMNINKEGLQADQSQNQYTENFIILEIFKQIKNEDLILKNIIDENLAKYLYSLLQINNLVDMHGYLNQNFNSQLPFQLDFYNTDYPKDQYLKYETQINNLIKKTLVFSRIDYPVRFFISSSLIFDFNQKLDFKNIFNQDQKAIIYTLSEKVNIQINILKNGIFFKENNLSILGQYSKDLKSLNITGPTQNINDFLYNSLKIYLLNQDTSDTIIQFLIQDSINQDQIHQLNLNQIKFIQLYQPIRKNISMSLQNQFNFFYPNGNMFIQYSFAFSFNQNTFQFDNKTQICYRVLMGKNDDVMEDIKNYDWIQFNSLSLIKQIFQIQTIYGLAPNSQFLENYIVKIIAYDGYSESEDEIIIKFNKIPFSYIFEILFKTLLPIIFLVIIWSYKMQIYLFIKEKNNIYQNETALIGQNFEKKIILFGRVQSDAIKLWNIFLKRNKGIEQKIQIDYQQNKEVDIYLILKKIEVIYEQLKQDFPKLDPREFCCNDSRLVRSIKRQIYEILMKQSPNTLNVYRTLKEHAIEQTKSCKNWYKLYLIINQFNQKQQDNNKSNNNNNNKISKTLKHANEYEKEDNIPKLSIFDQLSFQQLRFRQSKSERKIKISQNQDKLDCLSTYSLNNQLKQQSIYSPCRKNDQKQSIFKNFKEQQSNESFQQNAQEQFNLNPFPGIQINESEVNEILVQLKCTLLYDFNLLAEYLALEASGTLNCEPDSFNPSAGESLHLHSYDLSVIKAFKKSQNRSIIYKIKNFFNLSYFSIGLSKNDPLPQWLSYKIVDGVIHLFGIPDTNEESEILIRIFNNCGFAVYSFHIVIKDELGNDLRDQEFLKKATTINLNSTKLKVQRMNHSSVVIIKKTIEDKQEKHQKHIILQDSFSKIPSIKLIEEIDQKLQSPKNAINLQQTQQNTEKFNTISQTEQSKQDMYRSASIYEQIQNCKSINDLDNANNQTYFQNQNQESFLINETSQLKQVKLYFLFTKYELKICKQVQNEVKMQKFKTKTQM